MEDPIKVEDEELQNCMETMGVVIFEEWDSFTKPEDEVTNDEELDSETKTEFVVVNDKEWDSEITTEDEATIAETGKSASTTSSTITAPSFKEAAEPEDEPPKEVVNILLLGETGVGKSTWINAIANYLIYGTLEDAIQNEMKVLIPSQFTMTNAKYEKIKVTIGESDPNEVQSAGRSATQHPTSYVFEAKDTLVRIIDTPGIGDTRGIEQDKENFQKIMNHISHVDVIHGICILLKPNHSRLSISFEFCLKELLTQLHRDSAANIAFCFTNARSTFYRPGDTLTPLEALLTNDNTTPPLVPLNMETIYCLDNEAFRFLAAVKHGEKFAKMEQQNFSTSWQTSRDETERLVEYLQGIKPHATKNTVSLNETRQIISKLAKPLAEVSRNIQTNIAVLQDRSEDLRNLDLKGKNLRTKLKIPQIDLELIDLDYPKTVCAHPECTDKISIYQTTENKQIFKTNYRQVCHSRCKRKGVATNQLNSAALQNCACMKGGKGFCNQCRHGWEIHIHITYDTRQVMVEVTDPNVESDLRTTEDRMKATESMIQVLEDRKVSYEKEEEIITRSAAKFAVFLKKNSITPYNDAIIRYLDYTIQIEEDKIQYGGVAETLDRLRKLRSEYLAEEKFLLEAIRNSEEEITITLEDIHRALKKLYDLPLTGPTIRKLLSAAEKSERMCYQEKNLTKWQLNQPPQLRESPEPPKVSRTDRLLMRLSAEANRFRDFLVKH